MSKIRQNSSDEIAKTTLRIILLQRQITITELAKKCGVKRDTMNDLIWRAKIRRRAGMIIEAALNYTAPIWSTSAQLEVRERCKKTFGFDPELLQSPQAQEWCQKFKIILPKTSQSRPERISALMAFLAANPNLKNTDELKQ